MKVVQSMGALLLVTAAVGMSELPAQAQYYGPGYGTMQNFGYGPNFGAMAPGFGRGPGFGQPGRGRHTLNDLDSDGIVSAEEAASAADEVFSAMDADDDGLLTFEEYMAVRMGPQYGLNPTRQARMQEAKSARYSTLDEDGDGTVSKQEFMLAAKAHHDNADADGDGNVSPWEFRNRNWN